MPNLACAAASARRASTRQAGAALLWARVLPARTCLAAPRIPALATRASCPLYLPAAPLPPGSVDLSSTFYALNPSGDLADTQSAFQDWFGGMRGWQVSAIALGAATKLS